MRKRRLALWASLSLAGLFGSSLAYADDSPALQRSQGPKARDFFTSEQIAEGKAYRFEQRILFFLSAALQIAALLILLTTGAGGGLRDLMSSAAGHRPWVSALFFSALIFVALSMVSLPISLYNGYYHEHAYGLSTQRLSGWFSDYGKSTLITLVVLCPIALGLWALIQRFPEGWWLTAWVGTGLVSILLAYLAPVLIDPVFNAFKPLEDGALRRRVLSLAGRAGIGVEEVLEMDASRRTRHTNAYFSGLGRTRRIVIYDTLLKDATPQEAELILAHEIGHWRHGHIWKGIGLGILASLIILYIARRALGWAISGGLPALSGRGDPLVLAMVLLVVTAVSIAGLPIQNCISRCFERQADRESLMLTERPDAFIEAERKLALKNLDDVEPWWATYYCFYTHPSTMERIGMALSFKAGIQKAERDEQGESDKQGEGEATQGSR